MAAQPLHPRMRELLARIHRAGRPDFAGLGVDEARARYARGAEILDLPRAPLARVQALSLPMRAGPPRPARLYADRPANPAAPQPVLLFLHGGGFVVGDLETHDSLCRQLARRAGCAVLALDYRRAPEHRFPAAVEDSLDALAWLGDPPPALGLDPRRLALGGDSAGGTLAAVLALAAAGCLPAGASGAAGLPSPALQLLFYPACGSRLDSASHRDYAEGHLLSTATLAWFFDHYAPEPAMREDPRFAPLLAEGFEEVAPLWLGLAACDPLHDDALAYAHRLALAGVPVTPRIWPGVVHDFLKMGRALPEALEALDEAAAALRAALGSAPQEGA